jgi:acetamidase/formamidase
MKPISAIVTCQGESVSLRNPKKCLTRVGLLLGPALFYAGCVFGADVSGEWVIACNYMGDVFYDRLILKEQDGKFSGTLINVLKVEGTVTNNGFSISAKRSDGTPFADFVGEAKGDTLEGTGHWQGNRKITWTAKRPVTPPSEPRIHDFEPTEFHRFFADSIPPALRIFSGDTVRTWTVDSGGVDSKGVQRCPGGNPQTGPFYVEGALPGDTLAVRLNRVRLDRDTARSGRQIASAAVTADYIEGTKYSNGFNSTWTLDIEKGVARLKEPSPHLTNYTVKLAPMLGCIGVAPAGHQSFRTGWLGYYGGNIDYNRIREGTTIYLPVNVPGALLFVGDGHAAQGDGELTGDALETSLHVEFTVSVIRVEPGVGPHAENDEDLMFFGIANSFPEALQAATTGLAKWLEREQKLGPNEIAMVMGTAVRYDIAELVDPQIHVVARLRKDALAGLK